MSDDGKSREDDFEEDINNELTYDNPNDESGMANKRMLVAGLKSQAKINFEDSRRTNRVHQISKLISRSMMAFALLCMALSLVSKEIEFTGISSAGSSNSDTSSSTPVEESIIPFYIAILNMIVSILMVIINIFRKVLTFRLAIFRLERPENARFFTRGIVIRLAMQSIMIALCPLPFFSKKNTCSMNKIVGKELCYKYNDFLHILQFYKLYFIIKSLTTNSDFSSASAYRVCSVYCTKPTNTFVIKCMMKEVPLRFIITIFVLGIVFFGYALRIAESPLFLVDKSPDLSDFYKCCWTAMITMATIGYGDFYPRTTLGRFIMFICCIYGMVVTSLMVTFVSQELQLSSGETRAYTVINRLEIRKTLQQKASSIINKIGKYIVLRRYGESKDKERAAILNDVIERSKDVKNLNNEYKSTQEHIVDEDMERSFALITNEIKELRFVMGRINDGVKEYNKMYK